MLYYIYIDVYLGVHGNLISTGMFDIPYPYPSRTFFPYITYWSPPGAHTKTMKSGMSCKIHRVMPPKTSSIPFMRKYIDFCWRNQPVSPQQGSISVTHVNQFGNTELQFLKASIWLYPNFEILQFFTVSQSNHQPSNLSILIVYLYMFTLWNSISPSAKRWSDQDPQHCVQRKPGVDPRNPSLRL